MQQGCTEGLANQVVEGRKLHLRNASVTPIPCEDICEDGNPVCLTRLWANGGVQPDRSEKLWSDSCSSCGDIGKFRIPCLIPNVIRLTVPGTMGRGHARPKNDRLVGTSKGQHV